MVYLLRLAAAQKEEEEKEDVCPGARPRTPTREEEGEEEEEEEEENKMNQRVDELETSASYRAHTRPDHSSGSNKFIGISRWK